jgi:hypothetical protein
MHKPAIAPPTGGVTGAKYAWTLMFGNTAYLNITI